MDSALPANDLWVTPAALDAETTGYMLVPPDGAVQNSWRAVSATEAGHIWGRGSTVGTKPGDPGGPMANGGSGGPGGSGPGGGSGGGPGGSGGSGGGGGPGSGGSGPNPCPMCSYNIAESNVSLILSDTPVGYNPPIGPSAKATIIYNQRNDSQPAHFQTSNVGPKWSFNWQTFVTDDPTTPGGSVTRYLPAGGAYYYSGYDATTGRFASQTDDGSILVRSSQPSITYKRQLRDGSVEIYSRSDGSASYPRNIYLTDIVDPQGNALHINYDVQNRIQSIVDAAGRQTTFTYDPVAFSMQVTKITDPFGRSATLTYDASGRLASITDIIGLTSRFHYDANSLVDSMATPYGTSTFTYTAPGTAGPPRFLDVADPLGQHEREEWLEPAPIPASDPAASVPTGMPLGPTNGYLQNRDSFHWDKEQYIAAGCTTSGGCDYTKARDTHFLHYGSNLKSSTIESIKEPLENRVWYQYPGQSDSIHTGSFDQPLAIARVLDDGTTQRTSVTYDSSNYFLTTQSVDPLGRTTNFIYANGVDLQAISQKSSNGTNTVLTQFTYNYRHRPLSRVDAAGQMTTYQYNAAGQITSSTDPLGHSIGYHYNATGDLTSVTNANGATVVSYTYDAADRIATTTDSEGRVVSFTYDNADRLLAATYPDGTRDTYVYDKLDLASHTDRLGKTWMYAYDAVRNLTAVTDPIGSQVSYSYNRNGQIANLTDAKGYLTSWSYDVEGRLTSKHYADSSGVIYAYEATTSRLKTRTDALNQVKTLAYAQNNQISQVSYTSTINPTATVNFTYDPYFGYVTAMADGIGTTQYSYGPVGSPGALQVAQETGPLPGASIAYSYDVLGRLASRTVGAAGAETFQYDTIGRLANHASDLGAFTLAYLGQTAQITERALTGTSLKTDFAYLTNTDDRRLQAISNTGLSTANYLNLGFTSNSGGQITGVTETSDVATIYPAVSNQAVTFNNLNQIATLASQTYTYDANGNLTSDGVHTFSWDAANRLVGIGYTAQPGKATAFTYDGLGRRVAIINTPAGGGSVTTIRYVWCGTALCQAQAVTGTPLREYLAEGEYLPGSTPTSLYYGVDQIGTVRRVFSTDGSAPAYSYDLYGNPLQSTTPATDIGYAGMLKLADSGLNLTLYRAYDPNSGGWLARDPAGEASSSGANLYPYVGGNPLSLTDPLGLCWNWPNPFHWIANHPNDPWWLLPLMAGTIAAGGGPEDPIGDAAAAGEAALVRNAVADEIAAEGSDVIASTPIGRSGNPINVVEGTNAPGSVGDTQYSGHAFDEMQGDGIMPSVVDNAISDTPPIPGKVPGTTAYQDTTNNITVITDSTSGRVITVSRGIIRQ